MPRIDPQQLLNCLSVLLASNGGIKSSKEVNRLVLLMGKFSKKLVSKCIYVQILKSTKTELLGQFMADGGWALSHTWLQDGILTRNWPLVQELLELMLLCPVDVQRLKSNSAPKLVKGLSKEGGNEGVRILASKLVEQWLKIVKGETSSLTPVTAPRQDVIVAVLKPDAPDVKQELIENNDILDEADESEDMVDPLELPSNHVPEEDIDSKERLAKAKSDGLVFKITVKDGKQVLAKVESSPKKEIDAEKAKIKNALNAKIKIEPMVKGKLDSSAKTKTDAVDGKKQIKEKIKKESAAIKEQEIVEANKKTEKTKNESVKEKSDEKVRRNSKESRDSTESADVKESKEAKDKEKRKDSSSKSSSSKHSSSSRSSSHKSSRSSGDGKHKSSSSSSSRDKSKGSEKDRDRSIKSSSSSSKSSSKSSSSSSSKLNQSKEKRDSIDDKVSQSMKDKDTLTKVIPPSINKLGKIPKKPATDSEAATESVSLKKSSISIEVKKDAENRPKTVKTFNSQFRSHGLAEEAPPPPSRRGLQRPSSQPTAGASIPATIATKRSSPPPSEKKDAIVPEKKLKIDTTLTVVEKPGIKLIPAKPKTPVLVESDMFMDAIFASQTTKKDSARKRKRLPSQSTSETTKSEKVQSPDAKSVAPKFYQDTLDNESKDEDKTEETKIKDGNVEATKSKETNESADVEMQEVNDSIETKDAENVVVENKKPPGPGCGPNGPPGVLTILKRKGPKKQLRWKPQESLEEIHYFELDETERTNVSRSSVDMTQSERFNEREGDAFLIARKLNADDLMTEQVPWKPLDIVDDVPAPPDGSSSKEKKIQSDRELTCLRAIYFTRFMIPESPAEPDMEQYQLTDASIIPLDDANGTPEGIKSFVNYPWPEPRGSPPHQPSGFEDQPPFNNFQPNFPFNNQPGWTPPNVIPPPFNGPHNMLNLNSIQPEPMNNMNMNMNMNPMPPFQQNSNFCPPNGLRNNFNNNFGNDNRMHSGPPQNNPNWFRPNGPIGQQNNWRPPMGNNNNRPRPDWNPRNVCRAFSKGFCRNGDKCQWLHPGINCPPFN